MNKYLFFCGNCSFKKVIQEAKDLESFAFLKLSPIQKKIPTITDKLGLLSDQTKKIKCPNCGFANAVRSFKEDIKEGETKSE